MAHPVLAGQVAGLRRPGLLPAEANSFVGRAGELLWLTTQLRSSRLITVVGPGGVGKTRLCLRAAASLPARFPEGIWIVELSSLTDPAELAGKVAAALGLPPEHDGFRQRTAVLEHLRDRRLLLILDTCEHLVDACASFAEAVLRAAPAVTVLATSRQPFDAPGEQAFPLPPMPVETDAVELFAQRAASVLPDFSVTPANRPDVVRLCRRLDGLPLAIELAAVRLRALPLAELATHLESGFSVLGVTRRGGAARHQTLRDAIEWSHALCTPTEQALWARLSVFGGPFDVAAAEAVCADAALPRDEVVHALIGLVDKSVVLRSDGGDAGESGGAPLREKRYRLLDTLREFGAAKLAGTAEQEQCLDRLTDHCLAMATRFDEHVLDDDQTDRLRQLRAEHGNLRAALAHSLDGGDAGPACAEQAGRWRRGCWLAVRLHAYWQMSGLLGEGRDYLDAALRVIPEPSPERAWALAVRGRLATFQGDLANAVADLRESIGLADELGEELAAARGSLYLNLALTFSGEHEQAEAAGLTARQRLTAADDRVGLVCLEPQLAQLRQLAGDIDAALECCRRGQAELGDFSPRGAERWITGQLQLIAGLAHGRRPGADADCGIALRRALQARHDLGNEAGVAYCLEVLGWLAARDGRFDRAAWLLGAANPLWRRAGTRLSNIAILEQSHQLVAAQARQALGDTAYETAQAQGGALDLDTIVGYAMDGRGSASPPPARQAAAPPAENDGPGDRDGGGEAAPPVTAATLTRREREIASLVGGGLSNREIASRLFISKRTVDAHVEHIFAKLEISSRVKLTLWLRAEGRADT
ncbi:MAG: LuxR C-terminal-related transcriptional regulator [Trebonia sp.]|jgi:non-specific serine/threonine protein kinase